MGLSKIYTALTCRVIELRAAMRDLVVVLGDQLDLNSSAFDQFDPSQDCVWMAEVIEESTHVRSHRARIALFLSAMRHFRDALEAKGWPVRYTALDDSQNTGTLQGELARAIGTIGPAQVIAVEPGEYRVRDALLRACPLLKIIPDRHFLCSTNQFAAYAKERKQLRLEFFYREMRRVHRVLMDGSGPEGGAWNFDSQNRDSLGRRGPVDLADAIRFPPDETTREILKLVESRFPTHPGSLQHFDWPVTPMQAQTALRDFIEHRLPAFGRYQDAMWTTEPYLYHSLLSTSLNLKLIDPRDVIRAAESAYRAGTAPLAAVEGFIRQILGWREYVRGIYWQFMPDYKHRNALDASAPLPDFYWTAKTEMNCLRHAVGQTLEYGYAHHIQRLMITGLFALLLGVDPRQIHEWYLAIYVDAVEWVELPNTIGMSQFGDGGAMASKPYAASGKYIQRMSNYCQGCQFDPALATGKDACPFTTLYWDFLMSNEILLNTIPRMQMQLRNLLRLSPDRRAAITAQAEAFKHSSECRSGSYVISITPAPPEIPSSGATEKKAKPATGRKPANRIHP